MIKVELYIIITNAKYMRYSLKMYLYIKNLFFHFRRGRRKRLKETFIRIFVIVCTRAYP